MATIKKESFGQLDDGRTVDLYVLRNTKGATVKVSNYGARLVGWRVVGRGYEFVDLLCGEDSAADYAKNRPDCGATYVPGVMTGAEIWTAREEYEGVRFLWEKDGLKLETLYSYSNDNELLIRYSAAVTQEVHCPVTRACFGVQGKWEICADKKFADTDIWQVRDITPEIEMEPGMFGYDPTCPIDYFDAGLKQSVAFGDEKNGIVIAGFTNLPGLRAYEYAGRGMSLEATDTTPLVSGQSWQAQTVFSVKIR